MHLIHKIKRASWTRKTEVWNDADLSLPDARDLVAEMVLSLPAGCYRLHGRDYGTNLIDAIYGTYGWMPSMLVDEPMLLGLQVLYPDKIYASFTLGLDVVEVKPTNERRTDQ
jgi:hypothetical protein